MRKDPYYDHLKPKLPPASFSQMLDQQLQLVEQQRQQRAASDLAMSKDRQKQLEAQQKKLLGFDVSDMSEVDKGVFAAKRDWVSSRINNYHYTGGNVGEFVDDINSLTALYQDIGNHYENTKGSRGNLEGWVTGTKQWTDKAVDLKDNMDTFNQKQMMWETSGVEVNSIKVDPNGDSYAYYTDINGNRLKNQDGTDMYGLVSASPTRGSQEFFSPTTAPYDNLLPAKFAEDFHKTLTKIRQDPRTTKEEKYEQLRTYVTESGMNNPSVLATAALQFNENYGPAADAVRSNDAANAGEGFVPLEVREYVDEVMRFLPIEVIDKSGSGGGSSDDNKLFPTTSAFNPVDFEYYDNQWASQGVEDWGAGITSLMVPRAGVGSSTMRIPISYTPFGAGDPRAETTGDDYKVIGVAMDENYNLFVKGQFKVNVPTNEFTQAQLDRLRNAGYIVEDDNVVMTKTISFALEPKASNEYISILANLGVTVGADPADRQAAATAGHALLLDFNDKQAQIMAPYQAGS